MGWRSTNKLVVGLVAGLVACSPTFDWREWRPDPALRVLFPCKPEQHTRQVEVGGGLRAMTLSSCSTGDHTFAVAWLDAPAAAEVTPLLDSLQRSLGGNVTGTGAPGGAVSVASAASVPGATPNPRAGRLSAHGQRPDGRSLQAEAQFFSRGLRIYQATVIGDRLDPQVLDAFFSSLSMSP